MVECLRFGLLTRPRSERSRAEEELGAKAAILSSISPKHALEKPTLGVAPRRSRFIPNQIGTKCRRRCGRLARVLQVLERR
jgi:hypothetical protein